MISPYLLALTLYYVSNGVVSLRFPFCLNLFWGMVFGHFCLLFLRYVFALVYTLVSTISAYFFGLIYTMCLLVVAVCLWCCFYAFSLLSQLIFGDGFWPILFAFFVLCICVCVSLSDCIFPCFLALLL